MSEDLEIFADCPDSGLKCNLFQEQIASTYTDVVVTLQGNIEKTFPSSCPHSILNLLSIFLTLILT
jgi:hypothetical protein